MKRAAFLFITLQGVDIATTAYGLSTGYVSEVNGFARYFMSHFGVLGGLLALKSLSLVGLGIFIYQRRLRPITLMNYFYSALAIWNCAQLLIVHFEVK